MIYYYRTIRPDSVKFFIQEMHDIEAETPALADMAFQQLIAKRYKGGIRDRMIAARQVSQHAWLPIDVMRSWRYLNISTGHLTLNDSEILDECDVSNGRPAGAVIVYKYEEGYFVPVFQDDLEERLNGFEEAGLSTFFRKIYRESSKTGIQLLRFDCDGDVFDEYRTFVWRYVVRYDSFRYGRIDYNVFTTKGAEEAKLLALKSFFFNQEPNLELLEFFEIIRSVEIEEGLVI
jgi:hypothetical protein